MQCPGRVCAALAAGLGGRGRCRFLLLPSGSSLPLHPSRWVLRVLPPGCPFPSPAGTPFHAVCTFCGLGLVALRVCTPCPLCVCALVLPRRTRLPPPPGRCGARTTGGPSAGRQEGRSRQFVPLGVSCPGPRLRLFRCWGSGPVPLSPCLVWGRSPPCGQSCFCELALSSVGAAQGRLGGGASCLGVGRPGLGALTHPTACPWGVRPGAYPLAVGAGGVGVGTRHPLHSARFCKLPLRAVEVAQGRPEGGRLSPGCGAPGVGRSPPPDRPSLGHAAVARYPLAVGAGGVGVVTSHEPYSARSCELALRVLVAV